MYFLFDYIFFKPTHNSSVPAINYISGNFLREIKIKDTT